MIHKLNRNFIILSLLIFGKIAFSQENISVKWNPDTELHLGACVDHNSIFESKQDCLNVSEQEWIDGGAIKTEISTQFISNYNEVSDKFVLSYHSDIKGTLSIADSFGAGGSMSYDFTFDNFFQNISNSLYFVVKAETSHGRVKNKDATLKPKFQELIDNDQFDDFVSQCGTHYVRFETRKSSVYAIISINNIEKEIRNKIIFKYGSSANGNVAGIGNAESNFNLTVDNLFKEISKYGKINIKYIAHGSNGIQTFSPVIASAGDYNISNILTNLSTALVDFNKINSAPSSYTLASFKSFGLSNLSLKKDKLIYLERTQANINNLFDASNQLKDIKKTRLLDYKNYYKDIDSKIFSFLEESILNLKNCYYDNKYDIKNISDDSEYLNKIVWPSDIFSESKVNLIPSYSKGITEDGTSKNVLTSISLVLSGDIRHSDYYKSMMPVRITKELDLLPTNGWVYDENNPSLGDIFDLESGIKSIPFVLRLESFNLGIYPEEDGIIKITKQVENKHKEVVQQLSNRDYLVKVETQDGFVYSQKVQFEFRENDIKTIKEIK